MAQSDGSSPAPDVSGLEARQSAEAETLRDEWDTAARWNDVRRPYTARDVVRLRGSLRVEHTVARTGAERLWELVNDEPYVAALGAITGNQAVQRSRPD